MGDRIIVTEDAPKPDKIIVVQEKAEPKPEKEVVITETTRIKSVEE
jgi:hypothetical protein